MTGRIRDKITKSLLSVLCFVFSLFCDVTTKLISFCLFCLFIGFFAMLTLPVVSLIDKILFGVREKRKRGVHNIIMPISSRMSLHSELYHDYLEVEPGIELHYTSVGLSRGQPLMLFLHGFPECWYSWRYQLLEFWEDYTVVAIDMRGYNLSSHPRNRLDYRMSRLVRDVKHTIEKLKYNKAILVAHDWGGAVAWSFAYKHPEMVEKLIVLNIPHPIVMMRNLCMNRKHIMKCWFIFFFQLPFFPERQISRHSAAMVWNIFRNQIVNTSRVSNEDIAIFQEAVLHRSCTARAMLNYYRNLFTVRSFWMGRQMNRKLEVNTLLIWGMKDKTLDFELCEQSIPFLLHARVVTLDDSSHYPQQDTPDEVNEVIKNFLET